MRISDWSSDVCSSDLAILLQPDMELVGVADIATDWRIKSVTNRLPLFASTEDAKVAMIAAGLRPLGTLDELLEFSDIIIDTTPKHVTAGNPGRYRTAGVTEVFQGGEAQQTHRNTTIA